MRILELEIWKVRGIKHLLIAPEGNNFLIYGPNGTGKSAVVDALDFLLTGQISRLSGKGTRGIHMKTHGPHLDYGPAGAAVRAVIRLPGVDKPVTIKRCMASPSSLEFDHDLAPQMEKTLSLARRGQHVLTRKDLLNYIAAEAGTRAKQIQELLNITEVERTRKLFVSAKRDIQNRLEATRGELDAARGAISKTIQSPAWNNQDIINIVNYYRSILGGHPVSDIDWRGLKTALKPPGIFEDREMAGPEYLQNDIDYLKAVFQDSNQMTIENLDRQLRTLVERIGADSNLTDSYSRIRLTEIGITMINEAGGCPLCGTAWPPGKLYDYLQHQLSRVRALLKQEEEVKILASAMADRAGTVAASLKTAISTAEKKGMNRESIAALALWENKLDDFLETLSQPVPHYSLYKPERVRRLLAPDNFPEVLQEIQQFMPHKETAARSPQAAWDTLTRLEENLKALAAAQNSLAYWESCYRKASIILDDYISARDDVLGKLYLDVEERFTGFYRQLHGGDEKAFAAEIKPSGAGVTLEVNFHGRGFHPPLALHSEGHQDSMGICLYFALAERLTGGLLDLIILDDVVLSIDEEHRLELCRLFSGLFSNRQLFITTHNKAWVRQLISQNVVTPKNTLRLDGWDINTGPRMQLGYL